MNAPRISIVIPAYNVELYVEDAIKSVLAQAVQPFEILIFNDGSTDGTAAILERFSGHERVRYFSDENTGVGPVRNLGAYLARGDYVYFFDADDLLDPHLVARLQRLIVEDRAPDIIMFSGRAFVQPGFSPLMRFSYQRSFEAHGIDGEQAMIRLYEGNCMYAQVCLYVVRREYWLGENTRFPGGYHQDEFVLFPLIVGARRVSVVRDVLFLRRVRPGSAMTRAKTAAHVTALRENFLGALRQLQAVPAENRRLRKVARERAITMAREYTRVSGTKKRWRDAPLMLRALIQVRRSAMWRLFLARFKGDGWRGDCESANR